MQKEKPELTKEERIARYLNAIPGAIAYQGGHDQTFAVACSLYNGWALTENETLAWLKVYNTRCKPQWSDKELEHKASGAAKSEHKKPRGHLIGESGAAFERPLPNWTLPTKPFGAGEIPTTLTTVNSPETLTTLTQKSSHSLPSFDEKHLFHARKVPGAVVNVVKPPFLASGGSENAPNAQIMETLERPRVSTLDGEPVIKPHGPPQFSPIDEATPAWITSQLKVFFAEGDIPTKEDGSPDMDVAEELAGWLKLAREAYGGRGIKAGDEEIRRTALACRFEHRGGMLPTRKAVRGFLAVRLTAMHELPSQAEQDGADPDF